jgi:hypothetical protein
MPPADPPHIRAVRRAIMRRVRRNPPERPLRVDGVSGIDDEVEIASARYSSSEVIFAADEVEVIGRWLADLIERGVGFSRTLPVDEAPPQPTWDWTYRWTKKAWKLARAAKKAERAQAKAERAKVRPITGGPSKKSRAAPASVSRKVAC